MRDFLLIIRIKRASATELPHAVMKSTIQILYDEVQNFTNDEVPDLKNPFQEASTSDPNSTTP